MSLNYREIDVILSELDIVGSHIQEVMQTDFDTLVLTLYKHRVVYLLMSVAQTACRIHTMGSSPVKMKKRQRFEQLLRSRIKGGKILAAVQKDNNRIVELSIEVAGRRFFLYARLWSGAGNILLTDENRIIIDAIHRRRNRLEMSKQHFPLPPPPNHQKIYTVRDTTAANFNQTIELAYAVHKTNLTKRLRLESEVRTVIAEHYKKLTARRDVCVAKKEECSAFSKLKQEADLLMEHMYSIEHGVEVTHIDTDAGQVIISLDPKKSAVENAQEYYRQSKRLHSGFLSLCDEIARIDEKQASLYDLEKTLCSEQTSDGQISAWLMRQRQIHTKRVQTKKRTLKCDHYFFLGWQLLVGKSAKENDALLRHAVCGNDWWFHVRDFPGAYVFVKTNANKSLPLEVLLAAGNLALLSSKARKAGRADIHYTQVKYLKRIKNAPRGTVSPMHEKNLSVVLDKKILDQLSLFLLD